MSTPEDTAKFNVVILYEAAYVKRAMVTYAHLARELAGDFTTDLHLWRLDLATATDFANQVASDLEAAELILIAVRGSQPCPEAFQRWRGKAGVPRGAIIALTEAAHDPTLSAGTWNSVLRVAAKQIHPEIFVWEPLATDNSMPAVPERTATYEPVVAGR